MSHPSRDPAALHSAIVIELSQARAASARGRKPAPQPAKPLSKGAQKWAERIAAKRLLREPLIGGAVAGTAAALVTYAAATLLGN